MKVIFLGTPEFAAITLKGVLDSKHEVVYALTKEDSKSGRGLKLSSSPVKKLCLEYGIPLYQPKSLNDSTNDQKIYFDIINHYKPDVLVSSAYGLILSKKVLHSLPYGSINIHASLLPRWRGSSPIVRSIEYGDKETGITIMQMDEGLDTGNILLSKPISIDERDTTFTLTNKLANLGSTMIVEVLDNLSYYITNSKKQNKDLVTYAKKIKKEEGYINWDDSSINILRKIKAFNPFPGCSTKFLYKGKDIPIKIWDGELAVNIDLNSNVGELVLDKTMKLLLVKCGDGNYLKLKTIQKPSGKRIDARDLYFSLL